MRLERLIRMLGVAALTVASVVTVPGALASLKESTVALTGEIQSFDESDVWLVVQKQLLLVPRRLVPKKTLESTARSVRLELTVAELGQCRFLPVHRR